MTPSPITSSEKLSKQDTTPPPNEKEASEMFDDDAKGRSEACHRDWICDNPLKTREGWAGWLAEDISTSAMVPTLILQAFATG